MVEEQVVLVDDQDKVLGTANKAQVHGKVTPLHRAFSVFIFNQQGQVLVQQRAYSKKTWPGIWSNSCCGHPSPEETYEEAINRRVKEELGIEIKDLVKVSDYQYKFEHNGVMENEWCPVYRGVGEGEIKPNSEEINDWKWLGWQEWLKILKNDSQELWSPWCKEEVLLLDPILAFK